MLISRKIPLIVTSLEFYLRPACLTHYTSWYRGIRSYQSTYYSCDDGNSLRIRAWRSDCFDGNPYLDFEGTVTNHTNLICGEDGMLTSNDENDCYISYWELTGSDNEIDGSCDVETEAYLGIAKVKCPVADEKVKD